MDKKKLKIYRDKVQLLAKDSGVSYMAIFGSFARGEDTKNSDVDVLVDFIKPATLRGYFDLEKKLSNVFGKKVDLITRKGLNKHVKPYIQSDLKVVYGQAT